MKQLEDLRSLQYFKEGIVYYSYLTAGGLIASIDSISYDSRYEKIVCNFENRHKGYIVLHAIESKSAYGDMLSLLYVGNDANNWKEERLFHDYIAAYTVNFNHPDLSEFGDIVIGGFEQSGALIRQA